LDDGGAPGIPNGDAGGSTDGGDGRDSSGGDDATGPVVCPTAPPFDETDTRLVDACTKPVWVAVGDLSRRAVSYDGSTWTDTSIAEADVPDGANTDLLAETTLAIHNGVIVIVGGNGIFSSADGGKSFQEAPNIKHPGFELYGPGVGFLNGSFWIVADGGTWTSTDGKTWTGWLDQTKLPGQSTLSADGSVVGGFPGHGHGVVSAGGKIIFTDDDTRYRMYDGTSWYESKVGAYSGWASGIAYGNGRYLMIGSTCCNSQPPTAMGLRATSTDGKVWSAITNDTAGALQVSDLNAVLWDGSRFFATAGVWIQEAYASPDGTTWSKASIDSAVGTIARDGNVWVGLAQTNIVRSTDGAAWTKSLTSTGENTQKWFNAIASGRVLK
jgi:hypothetical protein